MGEVYEAIDKQLGRRVALKFLASGLLTREGAIKRFQREATAIAALQHPHIAVLYEFGDWDGKPFLAMEYLAGGSLVERIARGPLPFNVVLRYALQFGRGLAYAHRKSIVHRDIKPANALFTEEGDLKIVDFGLAKWTGSEDITRPGTQVGTIAYLAPELIRGEAGTPGSDQFSYGVSLYEIAAGVPPFSGDNHAAVMRQILEAAPAPLETLRPDLPERFGEIVAQATSKNPADRFGSMDLLVRELEKLQPSSGTTPAQTPETIAVTTAMNTVMAARRRRKWIAASAILAAGLAAAALIPDIRNPVRNRIFGRTAAAQRSVMVLPLANIGADPSNAAFCEGLTETVGSLLSQIEASRQDLLVIPAGEARRGHIATVGAAAKAFNLTLAITGSVERQNGTLRIILNLIDARSLKQIDSRIRVAELPRAASLPDLLTADLASLLQVNQPAARFASGAKASAAYDLYTQGKGLVEARKLDEALVTLKKAVAADPGFSEAHAALAECYFRLYDARHEAANLALADAEADRALAANPGRTAHMVAGLVRQATGRYDDAVEEFGKMIALDPRDVEGYRLRAIALEQSGRVAQAEQEYLTAVRFKPGYWRTYSNLGAFYKTRGQYEKAAESLTMVTQLAPENAFGFRNLGGIYHLMGRNSEAVEALQRSIQLEPNAEGYSNLGTILFFEKHYPEAVDYYQKAVDLSPKDPRLYGNLGDALWQLPDRREQAKQALSRAVELAYASLNINPNNPRLRSSLGVYLAKLGRTAEAKKEISAAIAADPDNVDFRFSSARVHELTGDRTGALAALREALRRGYALGEVDNEPDLTGLRTDPRFHELVTPGKGGR